MILDLETRWEVDSADSMAGSSDSAVFLEKMDSKGKLVGSPGVDGGTVEAVSGSKAASAGCIPGTL